MASKLAQFEALLYVAGDDGMAIEQLCSLLTIEQPALRQLADKLKEKLAQDAGSGLQLQSLANSYKLTTKAEVAKIVASYFQKGASKKLSQSALEILAIIAYKQPITRVEIDEIRGVNSAAAIQTLIWRGLVKAEGVKEAAGHPRLFVTTDYFLQYFDYHSLADLPVIEDFADNSIDQAGQIDLFSSKGQNDKNLAAIKKDNQS